MKVQIELVETKAALDVLAERRRQVEAEGWTPEHDDAYENNELPQAATCYTTPAIATAYGWVWPWPHEWFKLTTPRRNLVKAGALILAEIERLDRAERKAGAAIGFAEERHDAT